MLRPAPHRRAVPDAPLWVTRLGAESGSFGMIGCPDCLRAYAQPLSANDETVHETVCRDCGTAIRYAVVKELDPMTSQPYAAKVAMPGMDRRANMRASVGEARTEGWR